MKRIKFKNCSHKVLAILNLKKNAMVIWQQDIEIPTDWKIKKIDEIL